MNISEQRAKELIGHAETVLMDCHYDPEHSDIGELCLSAVFVEDGKAFRFMYGKEPNGSLTFGEPDDGVDCEEVEAFTATRYRPVEQEKRDRRVA
jgi:hypothetical protein